MILSNILVSQCQELVVHKELISVICMGVLSAYMFVHMYAVPMEPEKGLVAWNTVVSYHFGSGTSSRTGALNC